ncbi:MAG: hypothetical protein KBT34_05020 [Prevotella sp.]|nr:hypothetical protein [Candidatus Prevotella equi]
MSEYTRQKVSAISQSPCFWVGKILASLLRQTMPSSAYQNKYGWEKYEECAM